MQSIVGNMDMTLTSAYSSRDLPELQTHDQHGETPYFDLIVVDITLETVRDGIPLARRISETVSTPIVFLTASDDRDTMEEISQITHYGVILKNSSSFVIAESIRMAFRLHAAHRKQLEQEYRYHSLVETITEIVLIHDPQGWIEYINRHGAETMGRSQDSLVGAPVSEVFQHDYLVRSRLLAESRGLEAGRSFDMVSTLTDTDGHQVTVGIRSSPVIRHGRYSGELVAARDISQSEANRLRLEQVNRILLSIREVHSVLIRSLDAGELVQEVCDVLVSNGAYSSAWILLDSWELNESRTAGAAGLVDSGSELLQILGNRDPQCMASTTQNRVSLFTCAHPAQEFPDCPLHPLYRSNAVMSAPLRYGTQNFGVVTVGVDRQQLQDPEVQQIFLELAADLSFALHSLMQKYLRDRAEAEALAQQHQLQTFSDYSPMSIITLDRSGRFVAGNPYFHRWMAYSAADLAGMDFRELLREPSSALNTLFSSSSDITSDAAQNLTLTLRAKSGDSLWGQGVIVPIPAEADQAASMIIVLADTTSQQIAEERLRQAHHELHRSEVRYRSLFQDSADMVFVSAADGTLIEINEAGAQMLGYDSPEELIGRNVVEFYLQPAARELFLDEMSQRDYVKNHEIVLKTKNGTPLFGSESATGVRESDNRNEPARRLFQGVIHDITERIRSEQESIRRSMELSQANEELRQAQNELVKREKLASIGELSAGIAHEVNNPLGFVRSNFSTLRRYVDRYLPFFTAYQRLPDPKPPELEQLWREHRIERTLTEIGDLFRETEDGIQRIVAIVTNLKDFSRAGNNELMEDYDINRGVESTLTIARNEYKYVADVTVEAGSVPPVACNANEINQVLLTLIVNAAQAIASGATERGTITIRTWEEDDYVCCSVSDNGPGIPAKVQGLVFQPFFTTKKAGEGTGLGLSIAYDIIVNRHGGNLRLQSDQPREQEHEQGTVFMLQLPKESGRDE